MKVLSPLRICGITKPALRDVSEQLGLFTARKPAYACLATRIPTGTRITAEQLEKVEQAESALMDMGFSDFRVRHPEGYAKLQVKPEQLPLVFEKREEILAVLEPLFGTVCLDMTNGRVLFLHEKIDGDGLYCYNWEHRQKCRSCSCRTELK